MSQPAVQSNELGRHGFALIQPGRDLAARRIPALDGWRGISISLVIAGHLFNYRFTSGGSEASFLYRLLDVLSTGGVCIFFAISGFIIAKLAVEERESSGTFSAFAFYVRRFFRIIPPLSVYLGFVLLLAACGLIVQAPGQTLRAFFFACNLPGFYCGRFAGHIWSLAYEEQFYVLLPLIMWRDPRLTFSTLLIALLSVPLVRYFLHLGHTASLVAHATFFFSFICAGAVLAVHGRPLERLCKSRLGERAWTIALLLTLGLFLLDAQGQAMAPVLHLARARALLVPTLEPLCVAWLVASVAYQSNAMTRVLNWAPLNLIGRISFSLYLWQALFTSLPAMYPVRSALLFPPLMLACATLSYILVERPFMRLGRWLLVPRVVRGVVHG
jgi:peptidoglycan/LPS O-acetylase OafA/YrhL